MACRLRSEEGLTNSISFGINLYEGNETLYIITAYAQGETLENRKPASLYDAVVLVETIATLLYRIHGKGYVFLDLKPDNVFCFPETKQIVNLFDFDSVLPIGQKDLSAIFHEKRISYSQGFSPIEQKMGDVSAIGTCSDVYSIGALLFYLCFGHAPGVFDLDKYGEEKDFIKCYDYEKMNYKGVYKDKLYLQLSKFFVGTLQSYYKDRISMDELLLSLRQIREFADLSKPFLVGNHFGIDNHFLGREKELSKLAEWDVSGEQVLFVTGMGGIGKSTLVRQYIAESRITRTSVFIYCNKNLVASIVDDRSFYINNCSQASGEKKEEYFERKIKVLKDIVAVDDVLIVLDNFTFAIDDDFLKLLSTGCRFIIITREDKTESAYLSMVIKPFENLQDKQKLFIAKVGSLEEIPKETDETFENAILTTYANIIDRADIWKMNDIIERVDGHTLSIEFIAKQIANSYLSFDEAIELLTKNGFSNMATEKVAYFKDGKRHYDHIYDLVSALYSVDNLSDHKKRLLKVLSLFDMPGFGVRELKEILELYSLDDINELREEGWVKIENTKAYLHPIILETIRRIPWEKETVHYALILIQYLYNEIKNKKQDIRNSALSQKKHYEKVYLAKSLVNAVGNIDIFKKHPLYAGLLYETLMNLPRSEEDYIYMMFKEIILLDAFKDERQKIDLYDYVSYLLCQKEDKKKAYELINEAIAFAKGCKDPYVQGKVFEMKGVFYDCKLNGAYCPESEEEKFYYDKMVLSGKREAEAYKKCRDAKGRSLYAKTLLENADFLMRGYINLLPERMGEIRRNLQEGIRTITSIEKEGEADKIPYFVYSCLYLTKAWFYTICEPNMEKLNKAIIQFRMYAVLEDRELLDQIEYAYITAANMMFEMRAYEEAIDYLEMAYKECEPYKGVIAFERYRYEILDHILEVYEVMKNEYGVEETRKRIKKDNEERRKIGIDLAF
ncbi:MAG: hypothetical protein MJ105_06575 [Lachnospiraceae bacterium]|nr:hypothetical protein [Lachnospiraceae bacterium]